MDSSAQCCQCVQLTANGWFKTNMATGQRSPLRVPPTPMLKQLGYGSGVSVFELDRSPRPGQSQSPWAVKRVGRHAKSAIYGRRLLVEADLLRKMSHPNIVGFRTFSKSIDGRSCLAMEKCGQSLGDMIEERREHRSDPYPHTDILKLIVDIGNALDYIHTKILIIHADIKSFNILVNDNFSVCKLCDFGVSLPLDSNGALHKSKSKDDYSGTECWSAPEVILNDDPITSKTDIFSFGLTIWEMMSLFPPHSKMDDSCYSIEDSLLSAEDSVMEMSAYYGTRPPVPDVDGDLYKDVLSLFFLATEERPHERPSANHMMLCAKNALA